MSAVSLYYYLQVLKRAYVMPAVDETPIKAHPVTLIVLVAIAAAVVCSAASRLCCKTGLPASNDSLALSFSFQLTGAYGLAIPCRRNRRHRAPGVADIHRSKKRRPEIALQAALYFCADLLTC